MHGAWSFEREREARRLCFEATDAPPMITVLTEQSGDGVMVRKERWEEIQR
jgi:hypothetical protein